MSNSNLNLINTTIATANDLRNQHDTYINVTLVRTNNELYNILSKVQELYVNAGKGGYLEEVLSIMKEELEKRDVKVQKNTPKITVFIRYTLNCDRKRANKYKTVIEAAIDKNIASEGLTDFITNSNGIEEIRAERVKTDKQLAKEEKLANEILAVDGKLKSMPAVFTHKFEGQSVASSDGYDYAFVIARRNANGELELLQAVPTVSKVMVDSAIKSIANANLASKEKQEKEQEAATDESVMSSAAQSMEKIAA